MSSDILALLILFGIYFLSMLCWRKVEKGRTRRICERIRQTYPNAVMEGNRAISFSYKGFNTKLVWITGTTSRARADAHRSTWLVVTIPEEIRQEMSCIGFDLQIPDLQKVVSGGLRVSPNFVRQHCTAEAHDIVKQALLQNKNFFRVFANVVDIANGHDIQVKLNSEQFYISFRGLPRDNKPERELDDSVNTLADDLAAFLDASIRLFDQAILFAASVNPDLRSIPVITENFKERASDVYSDEDVYDSLNDSSPENRNPAGSKNGWKKTSDVNDDERALPEESGGGYMPPDAEKMEYDDEVISRK